MKQFSIERLAKIIKAQPAKNAGVLTGVSVDSRTLQPGDCFFAVAGENFDGHDYVAQAFTKGAACAVVGKDIESAGGCLLKVTDTVKALGDFAAEYRRAASFKVVAITGSTGKTSTRRIACHVLSRYFRTFEAPKNFNNNIGLPLTLLAAGPEDEIVVAEIGSSFPGEIAQLTRIAQPDVAVVTNVYRAHLAGFGDLQTIIEEKSSIADGLRPGGTLIINGSSDLLVEACREKTEAFVRFGRSSGCDIGARDITSSGSAGTFTIDGTQIHLPLPGRGNVENALAAWAVCRQFGLTIDDFAQAVKTVPPMPMRAELLQLGKVTLLNDCYNANPASMENALAILAELASARKLRAVFICGEMAELGRHSRRLHAELGLSVARAAVKLILAVGNLAKVAAEAAKENAKYDLQTEYFKDTAAACNNLQNFVKHYDIILVKGSRTAGLERAVEKLKELFLPR